MRGPGAKSQRSFNEENICEEEVGDERLSKISNYDSSYFSKKMQQVDRKGKAATTLEGLADLKQSDIQI